MELKHLGRFEILEEIGAGGMGIVYKGRDPKINRLVALKVIRTIGGSGKSLEQKEALDRFHLEAQAAGQLSHKNIVTIYDVGEQTTPDGDILYIAMEYLDGRSLDYHITADTYSSLEEKVKVIREIAEGLDYAHKRDVIHRDVKPANIIVTKDGTPKLTDFGLARLSDSSLTLSGTILGTPNYMSPEQVRGARVDARSDFFALTIIFYEILLHEKPFAGDTITSVIYRVVNEDPIPPHRLDPSLPLSADKMIRKGLSKAPKMRYQDGAEFIEALDVVLKDLETAPDISHSTLILGKDDAQMVRMATAKPPIAAMIGGAAAIIAVVVVAAFLFLGRGAGPPKEAKVVPVAPIERPVEKPAAPTGEEIKGAVNKAAEPAPPETAPDKKPEKTAKAEPAITKAVPVAPKKGRAAPPAAASLAPGKPKSVKAPTALRYGYLTVQSTPNEAEVFIEDEFLGLSPVNNIKLKQGKHTLRVIKKGYTPYERIIKLGDRTIHQAALIHGEENEKQGSAAAAGADTGALTILAPSNSVIFVDGREFRKEKVELDGLSPGSHSVYIQIKGRKPYNKRITIKTGKTKTIDVR